MELPRTHVQPAFCEITLGRSIKRQLARSEAARFWIAQTDILSILMALWKMVAYRTNVFPKIPKTREVWHQIWINICSVGDGTVYFVMKLFKSSESMVFAFGSSSLNDHLLKILEMRVVFFIKYFSKYTLHHNCLLYTSPSPRD